VSFEQMHNLARRVLEVKKDARGIEVSLPASANSPETPANALLENRARDDIQTLFITFRQQTGLPCALVIWTDQGYPVWISSSGSDQSDFCYLFRSLSAETHSACYECDLFIARLAKRSGSPILHTCHCGIAEMAVPIHVSTEGRQRTLVFITGQMKSPNGVAPNTCREDLGRFYAALRKTADVENNTPRSETRDKTEEYLIGLAEKMPEFEISQLGKILQFLEFDVIPMLKQQLLPAFFENMAGDFDVRIDFDTLAKQITARLRIRHSEVFHSIMDPLQEDSSRLLYLGLSRIGNMYIHSTREKHFAFPKMSLMLHEGLDDAFKDFVEGYFAESNGKAILADWFMPWLRLVRPGEWEYMKSSPQVIGLAPHAEPANGLAQSVEIKPKTARSDKPSALKDRADNLANKLYGHLASDNLANMLDREQYWFLQLQETAACDGKQREAAYKDLINLPAPSDKELRMAAFLRGLQNKSPEACKKAFAFYENSRTDPYAISRAED